MKAIPAVLYLLPILRSELIQAGRPTDRLLGSGSAPRASALEVVLEAAASNHPDLDISNTVGPTVGSLTRSADESPKSWAPMVREALINFGSRTAASNEATDRWLRSIEKDVDLLAHATGPIDREFRAVSVGIRIEREGFEQALKRAGHRAEALVNIAVAERLLPYFASAAEHDKRLNASALRTTLEQAKLFVRTGVSDIDPITATDIAAEQKLRDLSFRNRERWFAMAAATAAVGAIGIAFGQPSEENAVRDGRFLAENEDALARDLDFPSQDSLAITVLDPKVVTEIARQQIDLATFRDVR